MEIKITPENYEEVKNSDKLVVLDFWATWCGPCKMIAPHIAKLAEEYAGKIKVCKADVDQAGDVAQSFNVSSIPTVMIFKNGEITDSHVGAASYPLLEALVKNNI